MNERSDNVSLQIENERFRCDNKSMKEKLENVMCPQCDDLPIGKEERALHFQKMKMENQWLREQVNFILFFVLIYLFSLKRNN